MHFNCSLCAPILIPCCAAISNDSLTKEKCRAMTTATINLIIENPWCFICYMIKSNKNLINKNYCYCHKSLRSSPFPSPSIHIHSPLYRVTHICSFFSRHTINCARDICARSIFIYCVWKRGCFICKTINALVIISHVNCLQIVLVFCTIDKNCISFQLKYTRVLMLRYYLCVKYLISAYI